MQPDIPFRVAMLGNFRGDAAPAHSDPASRRPMIVDRDNVDEILGRLSVQINVSLETGGPAINIPIKELDDFLPDRIFESHEVFKTLRDLRRRLSNSATFAEAAKELRGPAPEPAKSNERDADNEAAPPPASPTVAPADGLLDQILDSQGHVDIAATSQDESGDWMEYIRKLVEPHAIPNITQEQEQLVAQVDETVNALMRDILHYESFQKTESAWRMVDFMVRRLQTDSTLKLFLLDLSKAELATVLESGDLDQIGPGQLLGQSMEASSEEPWSLLVGDYLFDRTEQDARLLKQMAATAGRLGAPFLAMAYSRVFFCDSLVDSSDPREWQNDTDSETEAAWQELRDSSEANYLGLVAPRFLLRLPYGNVTVPTEQFAFEEMPESVHENYLWGNPAFACANLIAEAFSRNGWNIRRAMNLQLEGIPQHIYKEDGETTVKPCTEIELTERACSKMLECGVMPLVSFRNRDVIRLFRCQSLSSSNAALAGRWQ